MIVIYGIFKTENSPFLDFFQIKQVLAPVFESELHVACNGQLVSGAAAVFHKTGVLWGDGR
jgi:hypothetical protein